MHPEKDFRHGDSYFYDIALESIAYNLSPAQSSQLRHAIQSQASRLVLGDLAVMQKTRTAKNYRPDSYSFTHVLPDNDHGIEVLDDLWNELSFAPDVKPEYTEKTFKGWESPGYPFIDAPLGIGLVYQSQPTTAKRLVALCTGGLTEYGPLIAQIQDVSRKTDSNNQFDPKMGRHNGLRHGLDWKQTTAKAWLALMQTVLPSATPAMRGKPCYVLPAEKNYWTSDESIELYSTQGCHEDAAVRAAHRAKIVERFKKTYDETAYKLGGHMDEATGFIMLPNEWAIPTDSTIA